MTKNTKEKILVTLAEKTFSMQFLHFGLVFSDFSALFILYLILIKNLAILQDINGLKTYGINGYR